MRQLLKIIMICLFATSLPSCRKIMSFFAPKTQDEPAPAAKTGNPCADEVHGWKWHGTDCINLGANFAASAIGYVRTLAEVDHEMRRIHEVRQNEFDVILEAALDNLYGAISETRNISLGAWLRAKTRSWDEARFPEISYAYRLPYLLAYEHLVKEDLAEVPLLADTLGRHFFEIIQTEKTKVYPFHDKAYRRALSDAEERFAIAANEWNRDVNADESFKAEFKAKLTTLLSKIVESRPKQ